MRSRKPTYLEGFIIRVEEEASNFDEKIANLMKFMQNVPKPYLLITWKR